MISKFDYCGIIYGEAYNAECKPLVKLLISSKAKKFIWPKASSFFTCHKLKEVKLIKKLWIGISYLQDHKLKHSFQGCLSLICSCGVKFETTVHYLFRCPNYLHERKTLWTISNLFFVTFWDKMTLLLVMFFSLVIPLSNDFSDTIILNTTVNYIRSTKRFDDSTFTF